MARHYWLLQRTRRGLFDRQLRRVTNIVDEANDYWLKFRFDAPPAGTFLEGVAGGGDSGSPALIKQDGTLFLAGVSSWQYTNNSPLGLYGCVEHYTRVSRFVDWIHSTCGIQENICASSSALITGIPWHPTLPMKPR